MSMSCEPGSVTVMGFSRPAVAGTAAPIFSSVAAMGGIGAVAHRDLFSVSPSTPSE
jgi:hypothetical protein